MTEAAQTSRRAIGSLAAVNAVAAATGLLQSVVIAFHFGTSATYENYIAATTLLVSSTALLQSGQLAEIFLPQYHRLRQTSIAEAQAVFGIVLNWMLLGALAVAAVMWLAAPVVIDLIVPGFDADRVERSVAVFRAVAPIVPIDVALALTMMLANAERWYGRPEMVATLASIVTVSVVAVVGSSRGEWGLASALWAGKLVHITGVLLILRHMGYRHAWRLGTPGLSMRALLAPLASTFVYVGATQLWAGAFTAGLSMLPQGTLAVLRYVQLFAVKAQSVFMRPVSVVFFTDISRILAGQPGDVRGVSRLALGRAFAVWTVLMTGVIAAGRPGLEVLLGWKNFPPHQLELAYRLLIAYTAIIGFAAGEWIWRKTVVSVGRVRQLYLTTAGVQMLCALLAIPLMRAWGIAGLVGVSALNAALLATVPRLLLIGPNRELRGELPASSMARWVLAGAAATLIGMLLAPFVPEAMRATRLTLGITAGVFGLLIPLVGIGIAMLLGVPEARELPGAHRSPTP